MSFHQYWKSPIKPCTGASYSTSNHSAALQDGPCPNIDRYGFVFEQGDISENWSNINDAWILAFAAWTASWHHIQSVNFTNNTVMFVEPSDYAIGEFPAPSGRRYYVENVLEELDSEGEWFYNKSKGLITYKPRSHAGSDMEFIIPLQLGVIALSAVENVKFECLSIQHSTEGPDNRQSYHSTEAAVLIFTSKSISVTRCDIMHAGACGIVIGQQSTHVTVEQSR